jgi:hypothetical protein
MVQRIADRLCGRATCEQPRVLRLEPGAQIRDQYPAACLTLSEPIGRAEAADLRLDPI